METFLSSWIAVVGGCLGIVGTILGIQLTLVQLRSYSSDFTKQSAKLSSSASTHPFNFLQLLDISVYVARMRLCYSIVCLIVFASGMLIAIGIFPIVPNHQVVGIILLFSSFVTGVFEKREMNKHVREKSYNAFKSTDELELEMIRMRNDILGGK